MDDNQATCYVCNEIVYLDVDKFCTKSDKYRHFWHGVPGITKTAPSAGIQGYAKTLNEARQRAEYYIQSNPYAAPEVKAEEQEILDEVERLSNLLRS